MVRAEDEDFDARLESLKKGGAKKKENTPAQQLRENKAAAASGQKQDFGEETVFFEGPPHRGDLAVNIAFGTTLLWLPLTFAAIGRAAFVNYKFTNKRISVTTSAPWKKEELNASYSQVKSVVSIGRGIGVWGDMVVELKNGDKIEMRALPRHKEIEKYVREQTASAASQPTGGKKSSGGSSKGPKKGFSS